MFFREGIKCRIKSKQCRPKPFHFLIDSCKPRSIYVKNAIPFLPVAKHNWRFLGLPQAGPRWESAETSSPALGLSASPSLFWMQDVSRRPCNLPPIRCEHQSRSLKLHTRWRPQEICPYRISHTGVCWQFECSQKYLPYFLYLGIIRRLKDLEKY